MNFEYHLSVRGYELDSFNHLNNAVYLNYLEQARWEILRELDLFDYFKKNQCLLVVTDAKIHYNREAKIFDELVIKTTVEKKDPYIHFKHKIYNKKNELKISQAEIKTLLINKDRIPMDLPEDILEKILNKRS